MKEKISKLFYIFLLMQPLIDLVTSIMTKYEVGFISLGVILRGLFILVMVIYLLFFCNTKYKKMSIFYVFLLGIFGILYFITKPELLMNRAFLLGEVIYLFKYMYFVLLFITLLNFYFQYHLDYKKIINIFLIDLGMYVFLILIPYITHTSFASYETYKGEGIVGWFYAANDISNIFILLFPFIIYSLDKKITWWKVLFILLVMFSTLLIGTKVAYFGFILTILMTLFYYLFYIKKKWKEALILLSVLVITIVSGNGSYVMKNIKNRVDKYNEYQETGTNKEKDIVVQDDDTFSSIVLLSSRDRLLRQTYDIYKTRSLKEKVFGIGFSNRESINDEKIEKLVEMDFFDVLFHCGIVAVILYLLPFAFVIIYFIRYVLKNKFKISLYGWMLGYLIILGFGASSVSGHLFSSPSVLIYYTLFMILFLEYFRIESSVKKKKISFLMLHLGQGGIERATVNTANALVKKYDVELVVAYKLSNDNLYDIDKHIKVNYLIDNDVALRVNKYKELLRKKAIKSFFSSLYNDYFKTKKISSFFKDLSDSVKVVSLKKNLMIKYLNNCDSDIIISTRVEYSTLLSSYGNSNSIKIAVEHRHHNNDKKYIRKIRNEYDNINYLVALTEGLRKDYISFLKCDSKTKVVCIPNMLIIGDHKLSKLKDNKVISIGRLVPGKRISEMIEIAKHFPDWEFEVIGDGEEKEHLEEKISSYHLSNFHLLGALKNEDALKKVGEASIFLMTSETEGLPMVLLEACSYGLPIVAYETDSGINDIVDDGINGYVIKKRNQEEMIEKLKELMNDYHKRKDLGKKAYQKSLLFSEKEIVKKWLEIL